MQTRAVRDNALQIPVATRHLQAPLVRVLPVDNPALRGIGDVVQVRELRLETQHPEVAEHARGDPAPRTSEE
eukprot:8249355-Pyramimonas_sp.AAC.1